MIDKIVRGVITLSLTGCVAYAWATGTEPSDTLYTVWLVIIGTHYGDLKSLKKAG